MAWERCNQDSVWREIECAALVGEDQPLCPDLPELDLSELDVSDLDADSFLGGLKWYSDQSEIISSQYGNEASNLFEKIDEENEANLLAVLTETLDSIPVDEDGLPSFEALADGDVTNASDQSCPSSPSCGFGDSQPRLHLKKLLLAPANSQLSYNQYTGGKAHNHAANSNHRIRPPPAVVKTENPWNGKARGGPTQQNRPVRRPCTELLKYLTATDDILLHTKASEARGPWGPGSSRDKSVLGLGASSSSSSPSSSSTSSFSSLSSSSSTCSASKKKSVSSQQQQQQQRGERRAAVIHFTFLSCSDHKGSPFENKTIERTLSVEIAGTPGLTPPTTPPHKVSQENPFKASLKTKLSSCSSSALACKRARQSEAGPGALAPAPGASGGGPIRKGPEQTELYAQLSKAASALPFSLHSAGGAAEDQRSTSNKRSRGHSDHDYCQATANAKKDGSTTTAPSTTAAVTPPDDRHVECKDLTMPPSSSPSSSSPMSTSSTSLAEQHKKEAAQMKETEDPSQEVPSDQSSSNNRKLMRDQEIRAELNKHFGIPTQALYSPEREVKSAAPLSPEETSDSSPRLPGSSYLHPGFLPFHDDLDVGRENRFLYPWEGTPLDLLFDCSPCSPSSSPPSSCSPSRGSVSPPSSLLLSPSRPFCWTSSGSRSRSRSHSGSRSSSSHHRRRSLSSSPDRRPSSWYDSYEEYQHERLMREEHLQDYEKREFERAEQKDQQKQKAIEERRAVYVGRLRSDCTRTELKRRFEVFGEIEECAVNLRDDGDNFGFITYRYTCDAFAAMEKGHTLRRSHEPQFELCFGGQKQFGKSHYTDLDSHSDDFDPASTKSKYDSLDFDSLLREAQRSLRR
uniref:RRM domain-containing protein n=1 Tax=Periophthalmus magnuspinnatus TaxID=409849 RepID=A0A3B4B2E2_9GOBI